jgi:hypothetical protein
MVMSLKSNPKLSISIYIFGQLIEGMYRKETEHYLTCNRLIEIEATGTKRDSIANWNHNLTSKQDCVLEVNVAMREVLHSSFGWDSAYYDMIFMTFFSSSKKAPGWCLE